MKKVGLLIIIIIIVVAVGVMGLVSLFTKLNEEKPSITAEKFEEIMAQKGYVTYDATSQFLGNDFVKNVYLAIADDYSYQIEFFELEDASYATGAYNEDRAVFESRKVTGYIETNVEMKNYSKYTLSSNGKYMVASRIDNTVIYVDVDDTYKDTVKALLDELGY